MNELGDFAVPESEFPVTRVLLVTLATLLAVLTGTGVVLLFRYRPAPEMSWTLHAVHSTHAIAGAAFVIVLAVTLAVLAYRALRTRGWRGAVVGVASLVFGAFVSVLAYRSGRLLAWDNLVLWAVRPNFDYRGVVNLPEAVRFVLVDGHDLTRARFEFLTWLHAAVLPIPAVAVVLLMMWCSRARREQPIDLEPIPVN
jgi:hypothetical protein